MSYNGQVEVLAPKSLNDQEIEILVNKKYYRIEKMRAEFRILNESRRQHESVSGETFQYLGRNFRLEFDVKHSALVLKNGQFRISRRAQDEVYFAFVNFYKDKGKKKLNERVTIYASRMGLPYRLVRIMDLKTRWASCNDHGDLNFHWKIMMAPIQILDYIVVHEIAHLKHPKHTEAFWGLVDRILPDYRERKEWLRMNGAGMDL